MKTRTFFCTLMLLALILCFSSEANAFQTSLIVTVYPERDFKGGGMNYDPGHYPLEGFTAGSIRVPPGLVVIGYEHSVDRIGYGKWVDLLETQSDLTKYDVGKGITYIHIFNKRNPDGSSWVRTTRIGERVIEGGWFKPRVPGEKPPMNSPEAVVAPRPKPAPEPKVCTISGQVIGDRSVYGTKINLFAPNERNPRVSVSVSNGQYTISNVPEGSYEVRGKMGNPMTHSTSRGPAGLKVVADGDQAVTCVKGQAIRVNFRIVSSE